MDFGLSRDLFVRMAKSGLLWITITIPNRIPVKPINPPGPTISSKIIHASSDAAIGSANTVIETMVAEKRRTPQLSIVCPISCGPNANDKT